MRNRIDVRSDTKPVGVDTLHTAVLMLQESGSSV